MGGGLSQMYVGSDTAESRVYDLRIHYKVTPVVTYDEYGKNMVVGSRIPCLLHCGLPLK
jgi:hypothetical protein